MKTYKIFGEGLHVVAYVKISKSCKQADTAWSALQFVRNQFNDYHNISGYQVLNKGERIQEGIPVFVLK